MEDWKKEDRHSTAYRQYVESIARKSEEFNSEEKNKDFYTFIHTIRNGKIEFGLISRKSDGIVEQFKKYISFLGIDCTCTKCCETMLQCINRMLIEAYREDYIMEEDDSILERFELDGLVGRFGFRPRYEEGLIDTRISKKAIYDVADRYFVRDTFVPELDRIFSKAANSKAYGHPVHYMIESDDMEKKDEVAGALLQALHKNGRVKSRRFAIMEIGGGRDFSSAFIDDLYKSLSGGTMFIDLSDSGKRKREDEEGSDAYEYDMIQTICEIMKRYRNQVLTVFMLNRACERSKRVFFDNLGTTTIVELKEDFAGYDRACEYMTHICEEYGVTPDDDLYDMIDKNKKYLPEELKKTCDEWYGKKIKTDVFPQYSSIAACRTTAVKEKHSGSAIDELNEMVGLTEAKSVIGKALNYYKVQNLFKDKNVTQDRPAMHMVFTGNPGTAKTSVARLFARIMRDNGLLSKGHLVEVGRGDLVGRFVGWTAQIVQKKFDEAMGGVLFIDEAYSLSDGDHKSFGKEAIDAIVQEMENRREDIVVIFAGYPEEMENFISSNPGLRSRIAFHVPFSDYDTSELCEIARLIGKSKGVSLTDAAVEKMATVFEVAKNQPDFGNGRYVRNIIELSKMNQAERIVALDPETVTAEMLTTIDASDIEVPLAAKTNRATIGFI